MKRALVIGLGISGESAIDFLFKQGYDIIAWDDSDGDDPGVYDGSEFSLVVISPGVSLDHPLVQKACNAGVEVIGEVELGCRAARQRMVGITGTNGKTTVSLLVGHVLNHAGLSAKVVGNVGTPLTSVVTEASPETILVCELSSYQLETMTSKVFDVGVILNITPDHLDRYHVFDAYELAKWRLYDLIKPGGTFYIGETMGGYEPRDEVKRFFCKKNLDLLFPNPYRQESGHDCENVMAAFVICSEFGIARDKFLEALESFERPPHRIELVTEIDGVQYYNDSKGTNIDAVVRAVEKLNESVYLIAGGQEKGNNYLPWVQSFKGRVSTVFAIGEAKENIASALNGHIPVEICGTLDIAVMNAKKMAKAGDKVLLSPGCSSFDMFKNYADRGNQYKKIVHNLK